MKLFHAPYIVEHKSERFMRIFHEIETLVSLLLCVEYTWTKRNTVNCFSFETFVFLSFETGEKNFFSVIIVWNFN